MRTRAILTGAVALGLAMSARGAGAQTPASRGWLGIMFQPAETEGALVVEEVFGDSPAQRVGLQAGDTVLLWNGRRDVSAAMQGRPLQVGDTVRVRVRRGTQRDQVLAIVAGRRPPGMVSIRRGGEGDVMVIDPGAIERQMRIFSDSFAIHADSLHQRIQMLMRDSIAPRLRELERTHFPELKIKLKELESALPDFRGDTFVLNLGWRSVAGAEFTELNEGLASYFGTKDGVLVVKVAPETPAARSGLLAGDVVLRVDGEAITSVAAVRRAVSRAETTDTRRVRLEILRKGQRSDLEMRWE